MANVTITIPSNITNRVLDGFAARNSYTGTDPQGESESKSQFLKRKLSEYIKTSVREAEIQNAANAARDAAAASVDSEIVLS